MCYNKQISSSTCIHSITTYTKTHTQTNTQHRHKHSLALTHACTHALIVQAHFDSNDNVLMLVSGRKTIRLVNLTLVFTSH